MPVIFVFEIALASLYDIYFALHVCSVTVPSSSPPVYLAVVMHFFNIFWLGVYILGGTW
jgi:hypothetical protein